MNSQRNPYRIEPPFVISFSGGRTSAYLLSKVVDAWNGTLPRESLVAFANTGREHEATLRFVRECAERLRVDIRWVEFNSAEPDKFRMVDFDTASRDGEPFTDLIRSKNFMPTPLRRICTHSLKVIPIATMARKLGISEGTLAVGLRADEPRRVHRVANTEREGFDYVCPLAEAGVTVQDVNEFWRNSEYDLQLPNNDKAFGNCDLCFLKGRAYLERVMRHDPKTADWWIRMEETQGRTFRNDRPTYRQMLVQVTVQGMLFGSDDPNEDGSIPCTCTD